MDKIIEMVKEVICWAMDNNKTIEMDLTNRSSSSLGSLVNSQSENLHIFISNQSPYTLDSAEDETEEDE